MVPLLLSVAFGAAIYLLYEGLTNPRAPSPDRRRLRRRQGQRAHDPAGGPLHSARALRRVAASGGRGVHAPQWVAIVRCRDSRAALGGYKITRRS